MHHLESSTSLQDATTRRHRFHPRTEESPLDSWRGALVVYLLVGIVVSFAGLGSPGIVMMEGMTVWTAEHMVESGDFLVPRLYGEIYTYKPPLVYWLTAASFELFGVSAWSVRLPSALTALLMGWAVLVWIGRATRPRTGLFAALAATTGVLWMQKAKLGEFDTVLAAFVGMAVAAAVHNLAVGSSRSSKSLWFVAYGCLTAAFLAKGVPAFMAFGPGLLVAAFATRQTRQLWSRSHLAAAALCALAVGAYLAVLWNVAGGAAFEQPLEEAHRRGFLWTVETFGRTLTKPLIILASFLPWSFTWPWCRWGGGGEEDARDVSWRLRRAAWAFLVVGAVVFMAVPTHETRYYLPLAVPAGLVSALGLERLLHPTRGASRLFATVGVALAVLLIALPWAPVDAPSELRLVVVGLGLLALLTLGWLVTRRPRRWVAYLLLVVALCLWTAETWLLRHHRAASRVLESVAEVLDEPLPDSATIWIAGGADLAGKNGSLYFYLDRPVRTFELDQLPPPGSYLLLTGRHLPWREHDASPDPRSRLSLVHQVEHPRGPFALYRVEGDRRAQERGAGSGGADAALSQD